MLKLTTFDKLYVLHLFCLHFLLYDAVYTVQYTHIDLLEYSWLIKQVFSGQIGHVVPVLFSFSLF